MKHRGGDEADNESYVINSFSLAEKFIAANYDLLFNEITCQVEGRLKGEIEFKPINENSIYRKLRLAGLKISKTDLGAILFSDFVKSYNPFQDFFTNLPAWNPDTDPDYINELAWYVLAIDRERFNIQFKKMLVRCIACTLDEKIFNKQAFILVEKAQNSGKSSFWRWLCPLSQYYAENINTDKDNWIAMCENFFINIEEVEAAESKRNAIKAMISTDYVKLRRPYTPRAVRIARICNFLGTANEQDFLNDPTGSVRWICFEIKGINWDYSKFVDPRMVWAQAYHLWKTNFTYQLSKNELKVNEDANIQFSTLSLEKELIQKYFEAGTDADDFYTASDILEIITVNSGALSLRVNSSQLVKILSSMFEKTFKGRGNDRKSGYMLKRKSWGKQFPYPNRENSENITHLTPIQYDLHNGKE